MGYDAYIGLIPVVGDSVGLGDAWVGDTTAYIGLMLMLGDSAEVGDAWGWDTMRI